MIPCRATLWQLQARKQGLWREASVVAAGAAGEPVRPCPPETSKVEGRLPSERLGTPGSSVREVAQGMAPGAADRQPCSARGTLTALAVSGGNGDHFAVGMGGQRLADAGLASSAGKPKQDGGVDAGGVGEEAVAGEFGGDAVGGFGVVVVLEEEVDGAAVLGPAAVAVGADHLAPGGGGTAL